jgi:hypothetical protein
MKAQRLTASTAIHHLEALMFTWHAVDLSPAGTSRARQNANLRESGGGRSLRLLALVFSALALNTVVAVPSLAMTSHAGWPPDQHLVMDKGPAGQRHVLRGKMGAHNYLLGGWGNDTIYGGNSGDVIWGDYNESTWPSYQTVTIHAGNGRNFIYANDTVDYVWTGSNPRTVVHAHNPGTSGVIHCQSSGIVVFLSKVSERHFKLDGCQHISHYSVGY